MASRKVEMECTFGRIIGEYCTFTGMGNEVRKDDYHAMVTKMRETLGADHIKESVIYGMQYVYLYGPRGGLLRCEPFKVSE